MDSLQKDSCLMENVSLNCHWWVHVIQRPKEFVKWHFPFPPRGHVAVGLLEWYGGKITKERERCFAVQKLNYNASELMECLDYCESVRLFIFDLRYCSPRRLAPPQPVARLQWASDIQAVTVTSPSRSPNVIIPVNTCWIHGGVDLVAVGMKSGSCVNRWGCEWILRARGENSRTRRARLTLASLQIIVSIVTIRSTPSDYYVDLI